MCTIELLKPNFIMECFSFLYIFTLVLSLPVSIYLSFSYNDLYQYLYRIQKERFTSLDEYNRTVDKFVLNPHLMTKAKRRMAVLHPLPRYTFKNQNYEIDSC